MWVEGMARILAPFREMKKRFVVAPRSGATEFSRGLSAKRATPGDGSPYILATLRVAGTRDDSDRGYRSLRSLNPRLNSVHRSAVRQKPCGISLKGCALIIWYLPGGHKI